MEINMKVSLADETFPPPSPGWTLRAWRSLNLGGTPYARGQEVPIEALGYNADKLLSGGHVRWTPPTGGAPKPPPPPPPPAAPAVPVDHIAICRAELKRVGSLDLVDGSIVSRAMKAYADMPKTTRSAAFGSGGALVKSGIGTSRRCTDGFVEFLLQGGESS
jgi:hypothetical protein